MLASNVPEMSHTMISGGLELTLWPAIQRKRLIASTEQGFGATTFDGALEDTDRLCRSMFVHLFKSKQMGWLSSFGVSWLFQRVKHIT
jgi:hypothetical protein